MLLSQYRAKGLFLASSVENEMDEPFRFAILCGGHRALGRFQSEQQVRVRSIELGRNRDFAPRLDSRLGEPLGNGRELNVSEVVLNEVACASRLVEE